VSADTSEHASCCSIAERLRSSSVRSSASQEAASRGGGPDAHGVLVGAREDGLVTTFQHAMDVLERFSRARRPLGEQ
jgi:hypothetical protein